MSRKISLKIIAEKVFKLTTLANTRLPADVVSRLEWALANEESEKGINTIRLLLKNAQLAENEVRPLCQDCGTVSVFIRIGADAEIQGEFEGVIQRAVAEAYERSGFRASIVESPMTQRTNTGDNTPAFITCEQVPGEELEITVLLKGGGSENTTKAAMLDPHAGLDGVTEFILQSVKSAGAGACPPMIIAVGVGGTFDFAAMVAKKQLLRPLGEPSRDSELADFERRLLGEVNNLGIGPAGLGGRITALDVKIGQYPTHIACLPVVVSVNCHSLRRASEKV